MGLASFNRARRERTGVEEIVVEKPKRAYRRKSTEVIPGEDQEDAEEDEGPDAEGND